MPYFKWLFTQKTKGREGGWNVPEKVVELGPRVKGAGGLYKRLVEGPE